MVRPAKNNKSNSLTHMIPLLGVLSILVIGLTFVMANSKAVQDTRSSAAPKASTTNAGISVVETAPILGSFVHYNYTLPKGVKDSPNGSGTQARIQNMCYQNGALVYGFAANAIDLKEGAQGELLGGGSSVWLTNGGPADCTATLYQWTYNGSQQFNPFATVSYSVGGK